MNSKPFSYLVGVQLARTELAQSYELGLIQQTPLPDLTGDDRAARAALARQAWYLKRALDTVNETSQAFVLPPSLLRSIAGFYPSRIEAELGRIQIEIDGIAFRLYGDSADRVIIEAWRQGAVTNGSGRADDTTDAGRVRRRRRAGPKCGR